MTMAAHITRQWLPILAAALVLWLVAPMHQEGPWRMQSFAENPPGTPPNDTLKTFNDSGGKVACRDIPEAKGGVLIGYLVPCIIYTIQNVTVRITSEMIAWLMPTVWAFITFALVMFGVKVVQGEGEVHKQGFLLLLKIGLVVGVLQAIPTVMVPQFYGVMRESVEVTSRAILDAHSQIHCEIDKYGDGQTLVLWKQLDCVMGKLYGYATGSNGQPSMFLAASALGLMGGFLFGGTFGVTLFLMLIGVLWTMFTMVIRTAFHFLNAYLYAALMFIITPLFLPLTLLRITSSYFDRWWGSILACVLLPLTITAYVMIAMMVYDKILFGPNAEINKLFDYEGIKAAQRLPKKPCAMTTAGNPTTRSEAFGIPEQVLNNLPMLKQFSAPMTSAANDVCGLVELPNLQIIDTKYGNCTTTKECFSNLFKHALKLLVVAMLINIGFQRVLEFIRIIIGSSAVANMLDATSPAEKKIEQAMEQGRRDLIAGFKKKDGSEAYAGDFISNIPQAMRRGLGVGNDENGKPIGGGIIGGLKYEVD